MSNCCTWHSPSVEYTHSIGPNWWTALFEKFNEFYAANNINNSTSSQINVRLKDIIHNYKQYVLYPDAESTLRECCKLGCKNYILSNNFPELPIIIQQMGLDKYFHGYIISSAIGYEKPRKEIFQHALSVARPPCKTFMIGDNLDADILGAKNMGLSTIYVHKGYSHLPDYCSDTLSQIPNFCVH